METVLQIIAVLILILNIQFIFMVGFSCVKDGFIQTFKKIKNFNKPTKGK